MFLAILVPELDGRRSVRETLAEPTAVVVVHIPTEAAGVEPGVVTRSSHLRPGDIVMGTSRPRHLTILVLNLASLLSRTPSVTRAAYVVVIRSIDKVMERVSRIRRLILRTGTTRARGEVLIEENIYSIRLHKIVAVSIRVDIPTYLSISVSVVVVEHGPGARLGRARVYEWCGVKDETQASVQARLANKWPSSPTVLVGPAVGRSTRIAACGGGRGANQPCNQSPATVNALFVATYPRAYDLENASASPDWRAFRSSEEGA